MTDSLFTNDSGWGCEGDHNRRKFTCPIQKMEFHAQKLQTNNPAYNNVTSTYKMVSFRDAPGMHSSFNLHTIARSEAFDSLGEGDIIVKLSPQTKEELYVVQTRLHIAHTPEMYQAIGHFYSSFRSDGSHCVTIELIKKKTPDNPSPDEHNYFTVTDFQLHKL